jgi:carbonic anhydrase
VIADGVRYNLLQFHFHQPSEHTIYGGHAPMEVHFVHLRADTQDNRTPDAGMTDCRLADRPVLVIGAFIAPGESDHELHKVFAPATLPVDSSSPSVTVPDLRLNRLLSTEGAAWRYLGGLTAPSTTCNSAPMTSQLSTDVFPEIVRWFVLQDSVTLPVDDIEKFHDLFEEGNARGVQPLNDRLIVRQQRESHLHR